MIERYELLANIRERLGSTFLPGIPSNQQMGVHMKEFLSSIIEPDCDPERSKDSLSLVRHFLIEEGGYNTPSFLCAFYLNYLFSDFAKGVREEIESIGEVEGAERIQKAAIACLLDAARGAEFLANGIFVAHETPPRAHLRRPEHVVARLLEEDKSGVEIIDWYIVALKKGHHGSIKTPFGKSILVSDPIKHYENRSMVIAGAELFKSLYLKLYPTAEQICSEAKPPFA